MMIIINDIKEIEKYRTERFFDPLGDAYVQKYEFKDGENFLDVVFNIRLPYRSEIPDKNEELAQQDLYEFKAKDVYFRYGTQVHILNAENLYSDSDEYFDIDELNVENLIKVKKLSCESVNSTQIECDKLYTYFMSCDHIKAKKLMIECLKYDNIICDKVSKCDDIAEFFEDK